MPRKPKQTANQTGPSANGTETVAGYFRRVFAENPRLLEERSNDALYQQWLRDHPGHTEVPQSVKNSLQNIKSVLRHQKPKKGRRAQPAPVAAAEAAPLPRPKVPARSLEELEGMIDECLFVARGLDAEGLRSVIDLLRSARNGVILQARGGD